MAFEHVRVVACEDGSYELVDVSQGVTIPIPNTQAVHDLVAMLREATVPQWSRKELARIDPEVAKHSKAVQSEFSRMATRVGYEMMRNMAKHDEECSQFEKDFLGGKTRD